MTEITREDEIAAFEKIRSTIERVHPTNRKPDLIIMPKLTYAEWNAVFQFYLRHV